MIFRARLDVSWGDLAFGMMACALPVHRAEAERRVLAALPEGDEALVCLAVRSGFDLLLGALALEECSEVLLSAITVPDMARIVRAHGLVPVPVDVDPRTLEPLPAALARAVSDRSRVLVAAHLFGAVCDFGHTRDFARRHGLLFVEDCAQSYVPGRFHGSPASDVRMLSFGPIKTDTAIGGAVLFVRDAALRGRMEEIQRGHPALRGRDYLRRILKYAALHALRFRPLFALFRAWCRLRGRDYDDVLREAARTFRYGELLVRLRRRPAPALLALLARRLETPNLRVRPRAEAGAALARSLPVGLARPGSDVQDHTHWIFPVLTEDPTALMTHLRAWGFDATSGTSSLTVVEEAPERPDVRAAEAEAMMARILFLPAYPEIPEVRRRRLADALAAWSEAPAKCTIASGAPAPAARGA